jgi:hypothetical protein
MDKTVPVEGRTKVTVLGRDESDATQPSYPVYVGQENQPPRVTGHADSMGDDDLRPRPLQIRRKASQKEAQKRDPVEVKAF